MITETTAAIAAGITGLVLLAAGSTLAELPPIDKPIDETLYALHRRRNRVLTGSVGALAVSAPLAAVFVTASTGAAWQAGIANPILLLAAGATIVTLIVEIIGTGQRSGWNAGGWARGTSVHATVAWYATLLVALADA